MSDDGSSERGLVAARDPGADPVARFERALGTVLLMGGVGGAIAVALWLAWLIG